MGDAVTIKLDAGDTDPVDVELKRLRLQDGDVLVVKVHTERVDIRTLNRISELMRKVLAESGRQNIGVLTVNDGDITFGVLAKESI